MMLDGLATGNGSEPFDTLTNASIVACPWNTNMTWDSHRVTENALHNLTFVCPFLVNHSYSGALYIENDIDTFEDLF